MNNQALSRYSEHLATHDPGNRVAMDLAHVQLICGVIFAHKPRRILELGIGSGFLTTAMLLACACNGRGNVTCVDNAHDWQGVPPPHFEKLRQLGVAIVISDERTFLQRDAGGYDLLVCDGDHHHTHRHAPRIMELANDGAFVFFHDTANRDFPNLGQLLIAARHAGLSYHEFTAASRPDERTQRGLLMVVNDRSRRWGLPLGTRLRAVASRLKHGAPRAT